MSNKRAVARQLKQKKKQQKQLAIIIASVIAIAVIGVFAVYGYSMSQMGYIMVYEGEKIDIRDFRFSVAASEGTGADAETVKQNALNLLLDFLTMKKYAHDEGVVVPEEERAQLLSSAQSMKGIYSQMGIDLSFIEDERVADLMTSTTLFNLLTEKHTTDYVVDEADFQTQFTDYRDNQKAAYYNIGLKYISTADKATMDEVVAKLTADNFDEVAAEFSDTYTEENGVAVADLRSLYSNGAVTQEIIDEILGLQVGGRTAPFALSNGSNRIIEVTSVEIPTPEELETTFREQYTAQKKSEMFQGILDGWIAEADYQLNQRAYDSITVAG